MPQLNPSIAKVVWAGTLPDGSDAMDPVAWDHICLQGEIYAFDKLRQRKFECFEMKVKK